jgi:hypothetical protein
MYIVSDVTSLLGAIFCVHKQYMAAWRPRCYYSYYADCSFLLSPSMAAISHSKPASTETFGESCRNGLLTVIIL